MIRTGPVLELLRSRRGSPVHIVDPFKVPMAEAVEKAIAVERLGHPALILASTDYSRFDDLMSAYVAAVKDAVHLPVILHFPPRQGVGFPLVAAADAVMFPALLGSEDDYFVWKSYLDTLASLHRRGIGPDRCPEVLLSAALTFGPDEVTYDALRALPISGAATLRFLAEVIRLLRFDLIYLYSRSAEVPPHVCRFLRENIYPEQLIFVSGGIRSDEQINACFDAGADYVGFAGALERADWRVVLNTLCPAGAGARAAS
jgi:heptaprenylglyceryl phosphate synthase